MGSRTLAHNDALIGFLVLLAICWARADRVVLAALALGAAAMIKAPVALGLVVLLVWVLLRRGARRAFAATASAGAFGLAGVVACGGLKILDPMFGSRGMSNGYTPWNLFRGGQVIFFGDSMPDLNLYVGSTMSTAALVASVVVGLGAAAFVLWRPRAGEVDDPAPAVLVALLGWILLSLYSSPWTLGWVLPVAALLVGTRLGRVTILYSGLWIVTAQWGIVTVASKWLEDPAFGYRDDINAVLMSVLLIVLLALLVMIVVDALGRVRAGTKALAPGEAPSGV